MKKLFSDCARYFLFGVLATAGGVVVLYGAFFAERYYMLGM